MLPTLLMPLALAPQNASNSLILTRPLNPSSETNRSTRNNVLQLNPNATGVGDGGEFVCASTDRFGSPSAASCQDALDQMPHDPSLIDQEKPTWVYGYRDQRQHWDVNLPKRYISCEDLCRLTPRMGSVV